MKKLTLAIFSTLLIGASGSVLAATTWGGSASGSTATQTVTTTNCPMLSESVTLTLSAHVVGGYACDDPTNEVQVAACHEGGSRTTISCSSYSSVNQITGCSDTSGVSTVPDYSAFFATSKGGVMQDKQLGSRCTTTSLGALTDWVN